jgi:hypothetical protein
MGYVTIVRLLEERKTGTSRKYPFSPGVQESKNEGRAPIESEPRGTHEKIRDGRGARGGVLWQDMDRSKGSKARFAKKMGKGMLVFPYFKKICELKVRNH